MKREGTMKVILRMLADRSKAAMKTLGGDRPFRRAVSLALIYIFLSSQQVMLFQALRAETGGATAPEVTKFEPVDTTDLVNLATGNFAYNIPILNVPGPEGGYPIALSYTGGILHAEEASWVGLGWNLQPGAVTRAVRGLPDDFWGEQIRNEYQTASNTCKTVGVTFAGITMGTQYDTMRGSGGYVGLEGSYNGFYGGVRYGVAPGGKSYWSAYAGYGFGNGLGIQATTGSSGSSIGISASLGGSMGATLSAYSDGTWGLSVGGMYGGVGVDLRTLRADSEESGSLDVHSRVLGMSSNSTYGGGGQCVEEDAFSIDIGGYGFDYDYTKYWVDATWAEYGYGYYYQHQPTFAPALDPDRVSEASYSPITNESDRVDPKSGQIGGVLQQSADGYLVMAQGSIGSFHPVRLEDRYYHPFRDTKNHANYTPEYQWPWATTTDPLSAPRFVFDGDTTLGLNKAALDQYLPWAESDWSNWVSQLAAPDVYLNILPFAGTGQVDMGRSFLFPNGGRRVVREVVSPSGALNGTGGKFTGFHVWESDGKYYAFDEPLWIWSTRSFAENALDSNNSQWASSTSVSGIYAYAWYLKELRYPDYLDSDGVPGLSDGDLGGWVNFTYETPVYGYAWSSSPDSNVMDGPLNKVDTLGLEKAGMMYSMQTGAKELKYLDKVETATHYARFVISPRLDSQQVHPPVESGNPGTYGIGIDKTADPNVWIIKMELPVDYVPGGTPKFTYTDPYNLKGFTAPAMAGSSQWNLVSHTSTTGNCPSSTNTYSAIGSPQASLIYQGIELKGTLTSYEYDIEGDQTTDTNGPNVCTQIPTATLTMQVRLQDQWWGSGTSSNANAFASLRARWTAISAPAGSTYWTVPSTPGMYKLDDIYLFEKSTNALIKQVHFTYDYSLCQGAANSTAPVPAGTSGLGKGKLTLTAIQTFGKDGMDAPTGGNSLPPYRFNYGFNPSWGNRYSYDRWGYYKFDGAAWTHRDANPEDQAAWSMTRVVLPTGGSVQIQYEPKDYARVQDQLPINSTANSGTVANYAVDLGGALGEAAWPRGGREMDAFSARLRTHPIRVVSPQGDRSLGIDPVVSSSPQRFIPIESAPIVSDYKKRMAAFSPEYQQWSHQASQLMDGKMPGLASPAGSGGEAAQERSVSVEVAASRPSARSVERMVTLVFENWSAGDRKNRFGKQPFQPQGAKSSPNHEFSDRGTKVMKNALVRMRSRQDGGADLVIVDPEFHWPSSKPDAMYLTYPSGTTHPAPKIGGGVRVKRIVSSDGHRSFSTSYTYTDQVNGAWTSSGVAALEPAPGSYSAQDDRVINPDYADISQSGVYQNVLYSNEGGGIVHSRVVVRHSFTDDPVPAGAMKADGQVAFTPMGETVFRFLTSADLPHKVKVTLFSRTAYNSANVMVNQYARRFDVFNMSNWWGQPLWQETRDAQGKPLGRTEKRFAQADAYLKTFYAGVASAGADADPEPGRLPAGYDGQPSQTGMGYTWADPNRPVPTVVAVATGGTQGISLPTGQSNYLSLLDEVSLFRQAFYDAGDSAHLPHYQSQVDVVREYKPVPLLSETRTFSDGMKLVGVSRNKKWDARTGAVLESEVRAARTGNPTTVQLQADPFAGHESLVTRTWPAYWDYPGMDATSDGTIINALTQTAQTTTSRIKSDRTTETFLNSKATTWWLPADSPARPTHWLKGGEFVWNGLDGSSAPKPPAFPGFSDGWTPDAIAPVPPAPEQVGGYQPYKASNWLFAGAPTKYDAFSHVIEAVEGDGVYGTSKYGYPYDANGATTLKGGIYPVAKFTNAKEAETLYWNFEGPVFGSSITAGMGLTGDQVSTSTDPMVRLASVYSGERAKKSSFSVTLPGGNTQTTVNGSSFHELRYFVKASSQEEAHHTYATDGAKLLTDPTCEVFQVVPAEMGWWLVRAKVLSGQTRSLNASASNPVDDLSAFPWRRNGAPSSVSHFAYDRALGLVTSITGANGRTTRYKYDALGRLQTVYDAYGNPSASTRYQPLLSSAALPH